MPVFWSGGFPFYESWMAIAVIGGAIYLAVPILVLIAILTTLFAMPIYNLSMGKKK